MDRAAAEARHIGCECSTRCPLMALFGHQTCTDECPLLEVKRTWREQAVMSANDPKRTLPPQYGGLAMCLSDLPRVICGRL